MPGTNKLAKNTFLFTLGGLLCKIVLFVFVPLFTFYLTTGESGTLDILTNASDLSMIFLSMGISEAVFRMAMEKNADKKSVYSIGLLVSFIGNLVLLAFVPLLNQITVISGYGLLLVAMSFTSQVKEVSRTFARGLQKVGHHIIGDVVYTIVFSVLSVTFIIFMHLGIAGYLYAFILANVAEAIYLFIACGLFRYLTFKYEDKKLFSRMILFAIPMIIPSTSWWMINMTNKIMVTSYVDVSASGIYSYAGKLPGYLAALFSYFSLAFMISAIGDYEENGLTDFYSRVYKFIGVVFLVLTSLLITLNEPFTRFFVDASYYASWKYVPIISVAMILNCFAGFINVVYQAVKKTAGATISAILGVVLNLVLCFILIKPFGVYGIVISSFVSVVFTYLYRYFDTRKFVRIHAGWRNYVVFSLVIVQVALCFVLQGSVNYLLIVNAVISGIAISVSVSYIYKEYKTLRPSNKAKLEKI